MIRPTELKKGKSPTQCDLLERNQRLIDALNFLRLSVKPITDSAASVAADFRAESVTGSHFMCWFLPSLHQHSGVGAGGYGGDYPVASYVFIISNILIYSEILQLIHKRETNNCCVSHAVMIHRFFKGKFLHFLTHSFRHRVLFGFALSFGSDSRRDIAGELTRVIWVCLPRSLLGLVSGLGCDWRACSHLDLRHCPNWLIVLLNTWSWRELECEGGRCTVSRESTKKFSEGKEERKSSPYMNTWA